MKFSSLTTLVLAFSLLYLGLDFFNLKRQFSKCDDLVENSKGNDAHLSTTTLPLQVFPLLKELRSGWGNMQVPPLLRRDASNTRALVVDVGLDAGEEFFVAVNNGFEVVGFEPNPRSFVLLAKKCQEHPNCEVVNLVNTPLPLQRKPFTSYLINAGAGASRTELALSLDSAGTSFVTMDGNLDSPKAKVPVLRIDEVIKENVFMLKIDTQGFDHFVLEGATELFKNFVVRQIVFEVEPYAMSLLGVDIKMTLKMLQNFGIICFSDRNDNEPCTYLGDSADGFNDMYFGEKMELSASKMWAQCWEDFVCLNIAKIYPGEIPPLL